MSTCLSSLESLGNLSPSVLRATRISKLLRNINRLEKIPRDEEFHIKTRVAKLLTKWEAEGNLTTVSNSQPVDSRNTGFRIKDEQEPVDAPTSSQYLPKLVVKPEKLDSDHEIKHGVAPANENSYSIPAVSYTSQETPNSSPECLVIDLTTDDELDVEVKLHIPHQPAKYHGLGLSITKGIEMSGSLPSSSVVRKDQISPKSDSAKLPKKRKRSDGADNKRDFVSTSKSGKI